jgi:hypothetical protein
VLGFALKEVLHHFYEPILNLECPFGQKVEPIRLKVAIYRNYLSLVFIPTRLF